MSKRQGGDGDPCPIEPLEHGRMTFMQPPSTRQYCAHQSHDGRPSTHPLGASEPTRCMWPKGTEALRKAVITTTLPEIDITLLGG